MRQAVNRRSGTRISRRAFLRCAGTGLFAGWAGLPDGYVGGVYAGAGPETRQVRFGIIALTDCSSIVVAHEKGFFKKQGIDSVIFKGASWAAVRDSLSSGNYQAAHMLLGMPIASTIGLRGALPKPMVIPWLLNRNGQAITLKTEWRGQVRRDAAALRPFVERAKRAGSPLTFAMTFPPGTHALWLRYYLGAGGIHPDRDISLVTVPPAQMIANMKIGKMDGFCAGEPWNERAVREKIGFTALTTQELWPDHPEKVCAFTREFAGKNPRTVKAVLKGLQEASVWLDDPEHRAELCDLVSRPAYINTRPEAILGRLQGRIDYGDGRVEEDPHPMHFSRRNCNYPQPKFALWWLTQLRRWGMIKTAPDYGRIAAEVMRPDLYEEAMRESGVVPGGRDDAPFALFDGRVFDPAGDLEAYAAGFEISAAKGGL